MPSVLLWRSASLFLTADLTQSRRRRVEGLGVGEWCLAPSGPASADRGSYSLQSEAFGERYRRIPTARVRVVD